MRKQRVWKFFDEIKVENFPNMEKEIVNQDQEEHQEANTGLTQGETHQNTD